MEPNACSGRSLPTGPAPTHAALHTACGRRPSPTSANRSIGGRTSLREHAAARSTSFGAVSEHYDRYRPGPAPAALDWLLRPDDRDGRLGVPWTRMDRAVDWVDDLARRLRPERGVAGVPEPDPAGGSRARRLELPAGAPFDAVIRSWSRWSRSADGSHAVRSVRRDAPSSPLDYPRSAVGRKTRRGEHHGEAPGVRRPISQPSSRRMK